MFSQLAVLTGPLTVVSVALIGTSPRAAAMLIKTESEDPNYNVCNVQGNAVPGPSQAVW